MSVAEAGRAVAISVTDAGRLERMLSAGDATSAISLVTADPMSEAMEPGRPVTMGAAALVRAVATTPTSLVATERMLVAVATSLRMGETFSPRSLVTAETALAAILVRVAGRAVRIVRSLAAAETRLPANSVTAITSLTTGEAIAPRSLVAAERKPPTRSVTVGRAAVA
ncbi:hypothetical protein B0H16DRAFT_1524034 [Mycena metata]|uniref:Uncharacterized protein n=1 Tax=Mycena metata TaxID=1033252 RepID=A0AAD7JIQ0_9AGAR|nr:hypothetical protein B0H16DRAFT_1524034 [Mycena metata]